MQKLQKNRKEIDERKNINDLDEMHEDTSEDSESVNMSADFDRSMSEWTKDESNCSEDISREKIRLRWFYTMG